MNVKGKQRVVTELVDFPMISRLQLQLFSLSTLTSMLHCKADTKISVCPISQISRLFNLWLTQSKTTKDSSTEHVQSVLTAQPGNDKGFKKIKMTFFYTLEFCTKEFDQNIRRALLE